MKPDLTIPIILSESKSFDVYIYSEKKYSSFEISEIEANENAEIKYQIKEGHFYDFEFSDKNYTFQTSEIVSNRKSHPYLGRLSPNIYVGTLTLGIIEINNQNKVGDLEIEVRSKFNTKTYREDYRTMLLEITEKCTDLLMQHNSVVVQKFKPDFENENKTLYQRFAFIKSILDSNEFNDSVNRIISNPVTKWLEDVSSRDVREIKRVDNRIIRQLSSKSNRITLQKNHSLYEKIKSLPSQVDASVKKESIDTPENRFIKYALTTFLTFIGDFRSAIKKENRIKQESIQLEIKLEEFLNHSIFKEISSPSTLSLNSPILQRKEGYREIFRTWLMFDLAASLTWEGGEDVYSAGKRDVAVLYEYWLFFKLVDLVNEVFKIQPKSLNQLIEQTSDGLGLKLKQGKHIAIEGEFIAQNRNLNIQFSYNRTFKGEKIIIQKKEVGQEIYVLITP